jgi:hypothetical protein
MLAAGAAAVLGAWAAALVAVPLTPLRIGEAFAVICALFFFLARTTAARAVWFNVAFVVLALGLFDAYVGREQEHTGKQQTFSNSGDLFLVDDVLGVRPKPGLMTTAKMTSGGEQIYDVVYTFDDDGLRITPPARAGAPEDCVLFFGDSYTFGEGVNDEESMPYRTGVLAAGRYRSRNFGFSGYGPHQMLSALENGVVESKAHCTPRYAVFQTEYHHVLRAAGIWTWDRHGPRYLLGDDGGPVRAGNFDSEEDPSRVLRALEKSAVATKLRRKSMDVGAGDATPEDVALYRAILAASAARLKELWPGLEFHVLVWDTPDEAMGPYPLFDDAFAASSGITIHPMTKILPAVDDWPGTYKLHGDIHPNAYAHDLIARYVVREILRVD